MERVPVFAFTAAGTPPDLARIREAEFDGQLLKPVEPETLLRCVDGTITAARLRRGTESASTPPADRPGRAADAQHAAVTSTSPALPSAPASVSPSAQAQEATPAFASVEPAASHASDVAGEDDADDADDYLAPLRARFRAGLPDRLRAMEDAVRNGDVDGLTREVHKLRGAAAGYGMDALSDAAGVAEEALRGGSGAAAPQVWALLRMLREATGPSGA